MPVYKDEKRNTWFCKFNFTDWQGNKKTKLKRGFATKKEALAWEREYLQVQQADMDMELGKFIEVYFTDKKGRLKERTEINKRYMIEAKVLPFFGKLKMNEVKAADILKWQNQMMSLGYKDTYLRMLQNQVTALFNHAERYYELKNNPCKKIEKMGRSNARELYFWTKAEFDVFIDTFSDKEEIYCVMYKLLFWSGCRVGEALALTLEDLNFNAMTISISKTYYRRNKKDYITRPKTESSNRTITIPEFLMEELKKYTEQIFGLTGKDRIFQITDTAIRKKMKRKVEKYGMKRIRIHDLRHSHIAFLIEKGVQPLAIAERAGHESINTTMNIYGHLYPNKQRQIADMLEVEGR